MPPIKKVVSTKAVSRACLMASAILFHLAIVPAASSKSECVFSAAGNTVTPKRANLNPDKLEECVIVRCNEASQVKQWASGTERRLLHLFLFTFLNK